MTPVELRERGYQALISQLGQIDTIRFLQQMGWGSGDYTQERPELLDAVTREEFFQDLRRIRERDGQDEGESL
jgi:hypothetical protein